MPTSKRSAALRRLTAAIALARLNGRNAEDSDLTPAIVERARRNEMTLLRYAPSQSVEFIEYMAEVWESIASGGHGIHDEALAGRKQLAIDFWAELARK